MPSTEKFNDFYNKFYTDSVFQISKVIFPLPGDNSDGYNPEEPGKEYFWEKEEWLLLETTSLNDTVYEKALDAKDSIVVEEIIIPNSGFRFTRKFQLKEGRWFIYIWRCDPFSSPNLYATHFCVCPMMNVIRHIIGHLKNRSMVFDISIYICTRNAYMNGL